MSPSNFVPQNSLETALAQAAGDSGARPTFYRTLLDSELLVLGKTNDIDLDETGHGVAKEGTTVSIQQWQDAQGKPVIPAFTSLPRLQEAIKEDTRYVQIAARALFEMLGNTVPVMLNPMSAYGKELLPNEIESLLNGSIFGGLQTRTVAENRQVLVGQPADYPQKLVDALKSLFSRHPTVVAAYLAWMHDAASGEPPHVIIGIQVEGDIQPVLDDTGIAIQSTVDEGQAVDFMQVRPGEKDISGYLQSTEAFYRRV